MNSDMEKTEWILGSAEILENLGKQRPYEIFSGETMAFLDALSKTLRREEQKRSFPDVAAFSFWCRRASILEMKQRYADSGESRESRCYRIGRGVSLHFAASNIPTLFGYSMAAALLAGDCVLVRLPSKRTRQEAMIVDAMRAVMETLPVWKERIVLLRSPHDREITDVLSAMCDVRVIWGGDRAVREIRQSPLPPRAVELAFADRRSVAVFSATAVLTREDLTALVRAFYNDTYRNDQNACSSPHLLFWLGEEATVARAKERFWDAVEEKITVPQTAESGTELMEGQGFARTTGMSYQLQPEITVKKWEQALYLAAVFGAQTPNEKEDREASAVHISRRGNLAIIVEPEHLSAEIWEETVPGGFFFQSSGTDLKPLLPALSRKVQTLTCFGIDKNAVAGELIKAGATGVDRIVEVGHALDFSLVWDGMDLIGQMSREISLAGFSR